MIWNSYVNFSRFEVTNSCRAGIICATEADHCRVTDCMVSDTWETGIGYYGNYGLVERCTVYNACLKNNDGIYTPPEYWGAGIHVRNQAIARNNVVHDVWGEGLSVTLGNNSIVEDNIIYDIASVLLYVMNCQDCIIQRNLVYMTKPMGNISSVGLGYWNEEEENKNSGNTIINNIVYKCRRNFYSESSMTGSLVANNTFINSTNMWNVQISGDNLKSGFFKNNVISQDDALPCIFVESGSGVTFCNNLFNKHYDSRAEGSGDITGDPLIAGTGEIAAGKLKAGFFMLTSASPAIDKGVSLPEVRDDIFKNKRSNLPDIGAHEFYKAEPKINN